MPAASNNAEAVPLNVDSAGTMPPRRPYVSARAIAAGCVIGIFTNVSNTYYGLQTGYNDQGALTASLIGFATFKALARIFHIPELSIQENILITSASTAMGSMPVTAGLVGTIPALEIVMKPADGGPVVFTWSELMLWSFGLAFFGLIFASIFHDRLIVREKLPWPGAKAFEASLDVLYGRARDRRGEPRLSEQHEDETLQAGIPSRGEQASNKDDTSWLDRFRLLFRTGTISILITIFMYFVPISRQLPILGSNLAENYLWTVSISPGYFGGGLITGPIICLHMLTGAIFGWGLLAAISKNQGWATGPADDWETGIRGWVTWVSLAALMADALVKLVWYAFEAVNSSALRIGRPAKSSPNPTATTNDHATERRDSAYDSLGMSDPLLNDHTNGDDSSERSMYDLDVTKGKDSVGHSLVVTKIHGIAFLASISFCCFAVTWLVPAMSWYLILLAVLLSLPMAYVGIRALAEADFNPQTGLVSQLVFAAIIAKSNPAAILLNVVAAGVATSGSIQAGDLAFDFKIGYDVGVPPLSQLYAQIVGSVFGAFVSAAIYRLYTSTYTMPSKLFPLPTSLLVVTSAKLLRGQGLPPGAGGWALAVGIVFIIASCVKTKYADRWWNDLIPSGISFAIGMFLIPSFTISRAVGGVLFWYLVHRRGMQRQPILIAGSGLVLGESLGSLASLLLEALKVPTL